MPLFLAAEDHTAAPATQLTSAWHHLLFPDGGACRIKSIEHGWVAQLENVGTAAIHVEVLGEKGCGRSDFELSIYLEPAQTVPVGANTRFFVSGRQASTVHYLTDTAPRGSGATAAAAAAATAMEDNSGKRVVSGRSVEGDASKRQRVGNPWEAGPIGSGAVGTGAAAGVGTAVAGGASDPLDRVPDSPMHLMRVRAIPSWANEGFLGVGLADLLRGDMRWCLVSNYMLDFRWLLSACPELRSVPRLVLVHGERPSGPATNKLAHDVREAGLQERTIIYAPPLPIQYGTHHSKAFLVEYARGLRVIIFTANAIYPDCNNKSQGLFWQDFPPKDAQSPATSAFQRDLGVYLAELKLPPTAACHCRELLGRHDFSAARAHVVASVPGYHKGSVEVHKWGHMRLRALLNREPPFSAAFRVAPLVAQYSSLGSIDDTWLTGEFCASLAAGRCGTGGEQLGMPLQGAAGLQLVWTTVEEVQNSMEGWFSGHSIPGPSKNVDRPFLQPYYCRWGGNACGRQRAMPHIKSYLRYQGQRVAWMYVGSHNLSKAAWGQLQKRNSQLMVRSYELGVLLVPSLEAAYRSSRWAGFSCTSTQPWQQHQQQDALPAVGEPAAPSSSSAAAAAGAAGGAPACPSVRFVQWQRGSSQEAVADDSGELCVPLPIPYSLPPQRYEAGERPWAVDIGWPGVDCLGCTIDAGWGRLYGVLEETPWEKDALRQRA